MLTCYTSLVTVVIHRVILLAVMMLFSPTLLSTTHGVQPLLSMPELLTTSLPQQSPACAKQKLSSPTVVPGASVGCGGGFIILIAIPFSRANIKKKKKITPDVLGLVGGRHLWPALVIVINK